jgi:hypothetical protein
MCDITTAAKASDAPLEDQIYNFLIAKKTPSDMPDDLRSHFLQLTNGRDRFRDRFTADFHAHIQANSIDFYWPKGATAALRYHFFDLAAVAGHSLNVVAHKCREAKRLAKIKAGKDELAQHLDFSTMEPYVVHYRHVKHGIRVRPGTGQMQAVKSLKLSGEFGVWMPLILDDSSPGLPKTLVIPIKVKVRRTLTGLADIPLPPSSGTIEIIGLSPLTYVVDDTFLTLDADTILKASSPKLYKKIYVPPQPTVRGFGYPRRRY